MIRLSDLRDKRICSEDGKSLGRVHEVHCDGGKISGLKCGPAGLIERLTAKTEGRQIPWERVVKIDAERVIVAAYLPKPKRPSAARTRQGTRRPTGRPSKR